MVPESSQTEESASTPLYPMLLVAWLVAVVAGLWALQPAQGDSDRTQALEAQLPMPAPLSPPWQGAPFGSDSFSMRYSDHGPVAYRLLASWEEADSAATNATTNEAAVSLDVRSMWSRELLDVAAQRMRLRVEIEEASIATRGPGAPLLGGRAAQESRALKKAVYQREHDGMGAGGRSELGRPATRAGDVSLALVEDLHALLEPRFPVDARLPGERWRYRVDDAGLLQPGTGPWDGTSQGASVEIEDRLREYIVYRGRPVLWIERRVEVELRDLGAQPGERAIHVKGQGRGTLLWDNERGELWGSDLALRFELPRGGGARSLRVRLERIEPVGQNALPSLPPAY